MAHGSHVHTYVTWKTKETIFFSRVLTMLHYLGTFKLLRMRRLSTLYLLGFSPQRCVFKNLNSEILWNVRSTKKSHPAVLFYWLHCSVLRVSCVLTVITTKNARGPSSDPASFHIWLGTLWYSVSSYCLPTFVFTLSLFIIHLNNGESRITGWKLLGPKRSAYGNKTMKVWNFILFSPCIFRV